MKIAFQQGYIIEGLRSNNTKKKCYGIIITARCDIENDKTNEYHYLNAYSLHDWCTDYAFDILLEEEKKQTYLSLRKKFDDLGLDISVIDEIGYKNTKLILNDYDKKNFKDYEQLLKKYFRSNANFSQDEKKHLLKTEFAKPLNNKLKELYTYKINGWHFIPENDFLPKSSGGIVVSLREFNSVEKELVKAIDNYFIDCNCNDKEYYEKYLDHEKLYIDETGYVMGIGLIESPRIEHLMQSFSHTFIRIGIDDTNSNVIESISKFEFLE